ncbi:MAG: ammonium transporter [Armatimonadetes bacterium]|nr:ammonium transporter [Armatimonadota bacterium]
MKAILIIAVALLTLTMCLPAWSGDAGGAATGSARDIVGSTANAPTADDLKSAVKTEPFAMKVADAVGQNRIAINLMWILLTGFLVMFMQAGFAMVETGFCRAKNAAHTMMMNFMVYPVGILSFWACGFALMFGGATAVANLGGTAPLASGQEFTVHLFGKPFGLFGTKGFFLGGDTYDVAVYALFLFQMVFMDTALTIPTGAMAERWKFASFLAYGPVMGMVIYPLFGNWAWGGGWLAALGTNFGLGHGYVDFAGSGVVHAVGGMVGLAGAMLLGPRIGKYNKDGSANPIVGHDIPMAIVGTLILAFGWFGFNPGSALGASGAGNLRIGVVAAVTMLASASGAMTAMIYMCKTAGKPDPTMVVNGMLAGLVAITAASGFVGAGAAVIIGGIAGVLVCVAVRALDRVHVDDPVGAVAVHGVNGLWGVLAVGLFADGSFGDRWNGVSGPVRGLFYGDAGQLAAQLVGAVTAVVWAFGVGWLALKVIAKVVGLRSNLEDEIGGLDLPEVGAEAYPSFPQMEGPVGGTGLHLPAPRPLNLKPARETE